ncbi:MAG: ATP-binding protein [Actinomycetota bacterium]|nr:ATP-binding protein [Actinomycetota bacterium]
MPPSPATDEDDSSFERYLDFVPDAILGVEGDGRIVVVNRRAAELLGFEREQLRGKPLGPVIPLQLHEADPRHQLFARRRDGSEFPAEVHRDAAEVGGRPLEIVVIRDIGERSDGEREKALQRQLDRARRLESVGQLAGGIAHDFNNLLGVIMNYAEFVAGEVEPDSQAQRDVVEIRRAAERAAALTRQLLIYSRREVAKPEVMYLREVVADLENLLHRALGERIELQTRFASELLPVEIDPGQFEQVLVNLAVNARDAMPEGGRLLVEIDRAELDEEYAYLHPDIEPGTYARLKVSDTGIGMDAETLERVFDPFFTTKEEGTGLGLATVYGIVTGAGGRIDLYSEVGVGTTVKIHLPIVDLDPSERDNAEAGAPRGNGEVILVAEDELEVRRMAERILAKGGFEVIGTNRGSDALEICLAPERKIDLLLTDVVMPDMLGTELVERAREARPELPVVFMSGYSHEVLAPKSMLGKDHSAFLEKPFSSAALLQSIHDLLG